jgi:hypothetical protein
MSRNALSNSFIASSFEKGLFPCSLNCSTISFNDNSPFCEMALILDILSFIFSLASEHLRPASSLSTLFNYL